MSVHFQGRDASFLVYAKHLTSTVAILQWTWARLTSQSAIIIENNLVIAYIARVMLVCKPRVRVVGFDREVTIEAEPPDDITRAGPVLIIDLDHPILVPYGYDQVAVRRRIAE